MNTQAISSVYAANNNKENGNTLQASEWNDISAAVNVAHTKINSLITDVAGIDTTGITPGASAVSVTEDTNATDPTVNIAVASGVTEIGTPDVIQLTKKKKGVNTSIVSGNNINIEPRESVSDTKGGNISFKPGDDIEFCSHHRLTDNQDEVSVKVIDGDDNPVKLQLNAASMTLTTKDKTGDDANVFDVNVNSGKNTKGYLKVRAQAIDLRCEDHGGIAIQPKGEDGQGHMNKIKFEHGGGDGLEFGTFNTEKTSIYTDEYRFKKDGVWKMATRTIVASDKADANDPTTAYKYVKAADDFYDNIDVNDDICYTRDIIRTASALNGEKGIKTYSKDNSLYFDCSKKFLCSVMPDDDSNFDNIVPKEVSDDTYFVDGEYYTVEQVGTGLEYNEYSDAEQDLPANVNTSRYISIYKTGLSANDKINLKFTRMPSPSGIHICTDDGEINLGDVLTLVNYFKNGAGQNDGPWANQL